MGTYEGVAQVAEATGSDAAGLVGRLLDQSAREREQIDLRLERATLDVRLKVAKDFLAFFAAIDEANEIVDSVRIARIIWEYEVAVSRAEQEIVLVEDRIRNLNALGGQ